MMLPLSGAARSAARHSVVIGAVLVVQQGVAQAYRTAQDLPEFEQRPERVAWENNSVEVLLNPRGMPDIPEAQQVAVLEQALALWGDVSCSLLTPSFAGTSRVQGTTGDTLNSVTWIDEDWPFEEQDAAATELEYEHLGDGIWAIREADIFLNAEHFVWTADAEIEAEGELPQRELLSVVVHELGHALGLAHPCELADSKHAPLCADEAFLESVMYPEYRPGESRLYTDDGAGLCSLYPKASCSGFECSENQVCQDDRCVSACGGESCKAREVCVDDLCVAACDDHLCPVGTVCETKADCGEGLTCRHGECRAGDASFGDYCSSGVQCVDGACSSAGFCGQRCLNNSDCSEGRCTTGLGEAKVCVSARNGIGEGCDTFDDCIGERCLGGWYSEAFCTRKCSGKSECPKPWTCTNMGGEKLCAPPKVASGCNVGGADGNGGTWCWAALTLLARRRRDATRKQLSPLSR